MKRTRRFFGYAPSQASAGGAKETSGVDWMTTITPARPITRVRTRTYNTYDMYIHTTTTTTRTITTSLHTVVRYARRGKAPTQKASHAAGCSPSSPGPLPPGSVDEPRPPGKTKRCHLPPSNMVTRVMQQHRGPILLIAARASVHVYLCRAERAACGVRRTVRCAVQLRCCGVALPRCVLFDRRAIVSSFAPR